MDWVAVVALVVAVVTLWVVIISELRQRRACPFVRLSLHPFGHALNADNGQLVSHMWELANDGTSDARISLLYGVGCEFEYTDQHPPIRILRKGEVRRLAVKPCDTGAAWVLICWTSPYDRGGLYVEWFAPDPGSELQAALEESPGLDLRWLAYLPGWLRRQLYAVRAVGPGGVTATRVPLRPRQLPRDLTTALSLVDPDLARKLDMESLAESSPRWPGSRFGASNAR